MPYNWSVDLNQLKKNKEQYTIWRLNQLINYGLNREKLNRKLVKKYWRKLHLDPDKKRAIGLSLFRHKLHSQ